MTTAQDGAEPGRHASKAAYVAARLRDEIESGSIAPGAPLRQTRIAQRYGVSPTPVREAFRLLEAEGTITQAANRVATVKALSRTDVEDLYLLRAEVEGLATALAAERMTGSALDRIEALHDELRTLADDAAAHRRSELNRAFHFAIYEHGSLLVARQASSLWALFPPRVTLWREPSTVALLVRDHSRLLPALAARDGGAARRLMAAHILRAGDLRRLQRATTTDDSS